MATVSKWNSGHGYNSTLTLKPWLQCQSGFLAMAKDFDTEAMASVSKWSCGHGQNSTLTLWPWPQCQSGVLAMATVSKWICGHGQKPTLTLRPWPKVDFDTEAMAWLRVTPNCYNIKRHSTRALVVIVLFLFYCIISMIYFDYTA